MALKIISGLVVLLISYMKNDKNARTKQIWMKNMKLFFITEDYHARCGSTKLFTWLFNIWNWKLEKFLPYGRLFLAPAFRCNSGALRSQRSCPSGPTAMPLGPKKKIDFYFIPKKLFSTFRSEKSFKNKFWNFFWDFIWGNFVCWNLKKNIWKVFSQKFLINIFFWKFVFRKICKKKRKYIQIFVDIFFRNIFLKIKKRNSLKPFKDKFCWALQAQRWCSLGPTVVPMT